MPHVAYIDSDAFVPGAASTEAGRASIPDDVMQHLVDSIAGGDLSAANDAFAIGGASFMADIARNSTSFPDPNASPTINQGNASVGGGGGFAQAAATAAPALAEEVPEPTFEELFQEQLQEVIGPDPGATFRNIYADILSGVANTPLESFILSQFEELQDAFITVARGAAEQGVDMPTFENFLRLTRPDVEKRFKFTEDGAQEAFEQILQLTGNVSTPYRNFVANQFQQLYNEFVRDADAAERRGEEPADFLNWFSEKAPSLEHQFGFTEAGAQAAFADLQRLGGNISTNFRNFIDGRFDDLFSEFQGMLDDEQTSGNLTPPNFLTWVATKLEGLRGEYEFTPAGARESFDASNAAGGNIVDPFNVFLEENFQRLFEQFQNAGAEAATLDNANAISGGVTHTDEAQTILEGVAEGTLPPEGSIEALLLDQEAGLAEPGPAGPATFEDFLSEENEELMRQFGLTAPGAFQSFSQGLEANRDAGGSDSALDTFTGQNFESLFAEFQAGAQEGGPEDFSLFLDENRGEREIEFSLTSGFERGQLTKSQLSGLSRIQ